MWRQATVVTVMLVGCGNGGGGVVGDAPGHDAVIDASADTSGPMDAPAMPVDAALPSGALPVGLCRDGWCWVKPLPQGEKLIGLWGSTSTDVWAIGQRNSILHFNGSSWSNVPLSLPSVPGSIWGSSASDVYIAASDRTYHYDGTTWSQPAGLTVSQVNVVGGTGPNDVMIADNGTHNIHAWDGTTWTNRPLPANGWQTMAFGGDATASISLSRSGGVAKWLGAAWGIADPGTHPANAGAIIDATHAVIATNTTVLFWDGTSWTDHTPATGQTFTAVAGTTMNNIWVLGLNGPTSAPISAYHWDGAVWTTSAPMLTGEPQGMWMDENGKPWAVMHSTSVRTFDGTSWIAKSEAADVVLGYGTAENDQWLVSSTGTASHWDGTALTDTMLPAVSTRLGIWGSDPNNYWIAAGKSDGPVADAVMLHWDGSTWSSSGTIATVPDSDGFGPHIGFTAVWGAAANDVYATMIGRMFHWDGTAWTALNSFGGTAIFGTSASDITVVDNTTLHHWDGTAWTSKTVPSSVTTGWQNAPDDIWLTRTAGIQGYFYDGSVFVANAGGNGAVGKANDMYTFAIRDMQHFTSGTSTPTVTDSYFTPRSGWKLPNGRVYAVTNGGLLVH